MIKQNNPGISLGIIVILGVLITIFLFPLGCEKKEEWRGTFVCLLGMHYQEGALHSEPIADTAQSQVVIEWNGNSHVFQDEEISNSTLNFRDSLDLDTLVNYTIKLNSDLGNWEGSVTIPGAISIISPNQSDTLPLGQDIFCYWSAAQGAFYYWVRGTVESYDSNGSFIDSVYIDENPEHSNLVIYNYVFYNPDAEYYIFQLWIYPHALAPITGETIEGHLFGEGQGDSLYFYVGEPVGKHPIPTALKTLTVKDRLNNYLEAIIIEEILH